MPIWHMWSPATSDTGFIECKSWLLLVQEWPPVAPWSTFWNLLLKTFDVTIFNAEPRGNYNRIMLSPLLAGDKSFEEIVTHDDNWYASNNISTRFNEKVTGVDPERKVVIGEKGEVPYDKLIIATGSVPFIIPMPGHDLPGVIGYRDLEDTHAMIDAAGITNSAAVVIGGGLLGLEAAAGLRMRGMEVDCIAHRRPSYGPSA